MTRTKLLVTAVLAAPLACSSAGNVNIGETQQLGGKLSDYAAQWDGYAEAYTFESSGSDRVRLVLDANGSGTLRVGDNSLLPPPTDGSVGYPADSNNGIDPVLAFQIPTLRDDFLYPTHAAEVQTNRIQVGLNPWDFYADWCALQTPVLRNPGSPDSSYGCLPNTPFSSVDGRCALDNPDGTTTPVDCGKLALCEAPLICECTATGCAIPAVSADRTAAQYQDELDAALDGTGQSLTGTLTVNGTRVTVHLQRQ